MVGKGPGSFRAFFFSAQRRTTGAFRPAPRRLARDILYQKTGSLPVIHAAHSAIDQQLLRRGIDFRFRPSGRGGGCRFDLRSGLV